MFRFHSSTLLCPGKPEWPDMISMFFEADREGLWLPILLGSGLGGFEEGRIISCSTAGETSKRDIPCHAPDGM